MAIYRFKLRTFCYGSGNGAKMLKGLIPRPLGRIRSSILRPPAKRACQVGHKYPDACIGDSPDRKQNFYFCALFLAFDFDIFAYFRDDLWNSQVPQLIFTTGANRSGFAFRLAIAQDQHILDAFIAGIFDLRSD